LARLAEDLRTGKWFERHRELMNLTELDCGLRILMGEGA
jgi:hypothetical protein